MPQPRIVLSSFAEAGSRADPGFGRAGGVRGDGDTEQVRHPEADLVKLNRTLTRTDSWDRVRTIHAEWLLRKVSNGARSSMREARCLNRIAERQGGMRGSASRPQWNAGTLLGWTRPGRRVIERLLPSEFTEPGRSSAPADSLHRPASAHSEDFRARAERNRCGGTCPRGMGPPDPVSRRGLLPPRTRDPTTAR